MICVLTVLSPRLTTGQCMYAIVPTWTVTLVNPLIFPNLNFSFSKSLELSSINEDLISLLLPEFRTVKEIIWVYLQSYSLLNMSKTWLYFSYCIRLKKDTYFRLENILTLEIVEKQIAGDGEVKYSSFWQTLLYPACVTSFLLFNKWPDINMS